MRLFVALDLDDAAREKIAVYLRGLEGFAPKARWAKAESLHVTLKFLGEHDADAVPGIEAALTAIHAEPISLALRGYGFFPNARAARVFWVGVDGGTTLTRLASAVDDGLARLAIPRDEHAYTPHLTLARGGSAAPRVPNEKSNSRFERLQQVLAARPAPDFGTIAAREFFLYESKTSSNGSRYLKLAAFELREGSGSSAEQPKTGIPA